MFRKIIWVLGILVVGLTIYGGFIEYNQSVTIQLPLDQVTVQPTENDEETQTGTSASNEGTSADSKTGATQEALTGKAQEKAEEKAQEHTGESTGEDIKAPSPAATGNVGTDTAKAPADTPTDKSTPPATTTPEEELSYNGSLIPNQASDSAAGAAIQALTKLREKDIAAFQNAEYMQPNAVFDACGDSKKYANQDRYADLSAQLTSLGGGIVDKDGLLKSAGGQTLEFCFSTLRNQVIVNVPTWLNTDEKSCKSAETDDLTYCMDALTIFSYDTTNKTLAQATRDEKTIIYKKDVPTPDPAGVVSMHIFNDTFGAFQHALPGIILSNGFGKRLGSYIGISSLYSEANCYAVYQRKYDYAKNTITLAGSANTCK